MVIPPTLRHALPWLLLGIAGLFAKCTYDGRRRAEGREAVALEQRAAAFDSLAKARKRVDSIFVADTVKLWRITRRTDTLIQTLLHSDTVTLTRRESVLVFVADSLVRQCTATVQSCEQRIRVRDSLLSTVTLDRDYWRRKSEPSALTRITTASKWLAVGFLIGTVR